MTTDRGALAALLATMTVISPAVARTGGQSDQAQSGAPQSAPVRGLEGLQAPNAQAADMSAIPVPAAPRIVLPATTPAPRISRPRVTERSVEHPATRMVATDPLGSRRAEADKSRAPVSEPAAPPPAVASPTPERGATPAAGEVAPVPAPQSVEPSLSEVPTPDPTSTSQPTVTAPVTGREMPFWLWLAVIVIVVAVLWALRRRKPEIRGHDDRDEAILTPIGETAVSGPVATQPVVVDASPAPIVAAPSVPAQGLAATPAPKFLEPRSKATPVSPRVARARLTCELRPLRAGLNLLSATVECELVVTNIGDAPAAAIRSGVTLLTAHAGQDTDLAQFNAAPIVRPSAQPFALAPGETRTIRTVTAIARDAIRTMTAANRPMFVPVVASNILYTTEGNDAQAAQAWVIGIERVDSAKLAPFWLDAPARMYTTIAARPHGASFDS